jgi:hypothetical protein
MDHPDAIPATLTDDELLALWSVSRRHILLSTREEARLEALLAELRQEACPKGWQWDEAQVQEESRRRWAERERINVSTFAA